MTKIDSDFYIPDDYVPSSERSDLANFLDKHGKDFTPHIERDSYAEYFAKNYLVSTVIILAILTIAIYGRILHI